MDITEDRLVNGLLKGFGDDTSPDAVVARLSQDVEIIAPASRATSQDLWPAIWALANILERQLFGKVYIRCGLRKSLPAPAELGARCVYTETQRPVALSVTLGTPAERRVPNIFGDARRGVIAVQNVLEDGDGPLAIECFLLSGYLGFAVLAALVGIPDHRREYARSRLYLRYDASRVFDRFASGQSFTCLGLGQLGQAYLALLHFLKSGDMNGLEFMLIDKDAFGPENGRTQVLLGENEDWLNRAKVDYIAEKLQFWGAVVHSEKREISWDWTRNAGMPGTALVGLHDFEARRIVSAAGFSRIFEAGVGTDLLRPRVTWHAYPGKAEFGKKFFSDPITEPQIERHYAANWAAQLKQTPGQCGWVRFQGISATAPCLGVAASALLFSEMGNDADAMWGSATLWSPCLPISRESCSTDE